MVPPKPDTALVDAEKRNIKGLDWSDSGLTLELLPVKDLRVTEEGVKNPVYADDLKAGKVLPPVYVWDQGGWFEVWDGNKRFLSHKSAGFTHIWALVLRPHKSADKVVESLLSEAHGETTTDRRFIGAVYDNGAVQGKELSVEDWPNIEHNSGVIPYSWRARWRYRDGKVKWTRETPEDSDLDAVTNWLEKRGVTVQGHFDFFLDPVKKKTPEPNSHPFYKGRVGD